MNNLLLAFAIALVTTVSIPASAFEYQEIEATHSTHRIFSNGVTELEITLSTEVVVKGECNYASLNGDFKEVLFPAGSSSLYKPYVADVYVSQTEMFCSGEKKEVVSIKRIFKANNHNMIGLGLRLLVPSGINIKVKEIK